MEDKELIAKLSYLKAIKPRNEWVALTRERLVEREYKGLQNGGFWGMLERIGRMVQYLERPAVIMPLLALIVVGGAVGRAASESLPGDRLYSLRAAAERIPLQFSAADEQSSRQFALAQQRLADLRQVAELNKVKNLPVAIREFEANVSKVSEGFAQIVENQPSRALQASRQIVQLQKEKLEVEKILGTKIGEEQEEEIWNATKRLVEYELGFLSTRSLTERQKELVEKAKGALEEKNYGAALEYIWQISQGVQLPEKQEEHEEKEGSEPALPESEG